MPSESKQRRIPAKKPKSGSTWTLDQAGSEERARKLPGPARNTPWLQGSSAHTPGPFLHLLAVPSAPRPSIMAGPLAGPGPS